MSASSPLISKVKDALHPTPSKFILYEALKHIDEQNDRSKTLSTQSPVL